MPDMVLLLGTHVHILMLGSSVVRCALSQGPAEGKINFMEYTYFLLSSNFQEHMLYSHTMISAGRGPNFDSTMNPINDIFVYISLLALCSIGVHLRPTTSQSFD